ncbi:hypothetical protein BJ165DRAFT_1494608 [Panaeolus papilionaceus]|nr:hypothetical protein BJ165DRAFT_1494608 [Panaeolus papilionaceus]
MSTALRLAIRSLFLPRIRVKLLMAVRFRQWMVVVLSVVMVRLLHWLIQWFLLFRPRLRALRRRLPKFCLAVDVIR